MKITSIASIFALAAATQAAPTMHTVTRTAEPKVVTVFQKADAGIDLSFLSSLLAGGHNWPFNHHHSSTAGSNDEPASETELGPEESEESSAQTSAADEEGSSEIASSEPTGSSPTEESSLAETDSSSDASETSAEPSSGSESDSGSGSTVDDWVTQMVCAINKVRSSHGASPLGISAELNSIAQKHSEYQNSINQMTHDDPSGGVGERLAALGISWMSAAENVAAGMATPEQAQKALEASPGHLANMVDTSVTFVGVGRKNNYYTQDFYGNGSGTRASNIPQCN
ncbi:hypothetical protein IWW55_002090 [Coemansia sp. RSA 2706]|nr:hypothetical protein IWW55_002090 [Coemansia sp. RSA 2706]KAJ2317452.1 hypothetical protein IWW52_003120 [Coemansia sp. RSA 2704]KAJ2325977.1 hypothetical protein IWW51_002516 [Coemansia sp. RSA 2702]KAJ2364819.1 hypothetical protein H4S01_003574 [Coemansia sp. RSA 2610]KAJ2386610.1 hypothetical protein H4S02_003775 [Coemansia sp. RSA 2611]KAJ2731870.1 hypothetical protein H4R23_002975 [Coemansia sp. Cherry 401B]